MVTKYHSITLQRLTGQNTEQAVKSSVECTYNSCWIFPVKGTFLSEGTDVFVNCHISKQTNILLFGIFKAALASQMGPSCPYKPLSFQTLRQFLSKIQIFKSWKIKCSSVWRYNKTSVSDKKSTCTVIIAG